MKIAQYWMVCYRYVRGEDGFPEREEIKCPADYDAGPYPTRDAARTEASRLPEDLSYGIEVRWVDEYGEPVEGGAS